MDFDGRTVIVTGASRGLGREIAAAFVSQGAFVHATGRDATAMAETESRLQACGGCFQMHQLEMTDEASLVEFIKPIPHIDVLVNNAGIASIAPLVDTSTEELQRTLAVNVVAPFVLMRETIKKMLRDRPGLIVNIASDAARRGIGRMAPYAASKHALLGLGRSVALELRDQGIRVTTYCPGPIETEILGPGSPDALKPQDVAADVVRLAALPPSMEVREVLVEPMGLDIS